MSEYLTKDAQGNLVRERSLSDYVRDTRDGPEGTAGECEDGYTYRFNTGTGNVDRFASKRRA